MESKPSNKKSKVKLKKGNPTSHGTPISHPFNFEHREHKTPDDVVDELTNNQASPAVTDQSLLPPPCPGNTNIDEQVGLLYTEKYKVTSYRYLLTSNSLSQFDFVTRRFIR